MSEWQPIETHKPDFSSVFVCRVNYETAHPMAVMIAYHVSEDIWLTFGGNGPQNYKDPTHWLSMDALPLVKVQP